MSESPETGRPKRWRTARIALIGSLALNIFFVTALGAAWAFRGPRGDPDVRGFMRYIHHAPDAQQDRARAIREARRPEFRAQRAEVRAARREVRAALEADPFDAARLAAAQERLRSERGRLRAILDGAVAELAASMPAEERARLAEALKRGPWRRRGPGGPRERPPE